MNRTYGTVKPGRLTDAAVRILEKRYFQPDEYSFDHVCERVATFLSDDDEEQRDFFWLMRTLDFLPNSPTLMNAGTDQGTLSACFVLPVEDSMQGITHASRTAAMVQKFGGGTGFSLSDIRPKNAPISTTHGKACGPVAVLKFLSATSSLVTQGGKRDGANMAVMRVTHPDIMEFITCKQTEGDIHNFNISAAITDDFMDAVEEDGNIDLTFNGQVYETVEAKTIWDAIIDNAWRNGEPGAVFIDRVNLEHPVRYLGAIEATNPCGEQPLLPYESCNLGSINLLNFVNGAGDDFDWVRLEKVTRLATRFLDRVVEKNLYATVDIESANIATRKIGLGVMGWADALSRMRLPYSSVEARTLGSKVMDRIHSTACNESERLAVAIGPFPAINTTLTHPRRNACLTSIAPTGTISMIAGVSSGIEPHFALVWRKQNILEGESFDFVNQEFAAAIEGDSLEQVYLDDAREGYLQKCLDLDERTRKAFETASDISYAEHIGMQAAFQSHCDSGVSKTINLPQDATREDVAHAYTKAWAMYCKGITVYRQGSRDKEVLVAAGESNQQESPPATIAYHRPESLTGRTVRVNTGRGKAYITMNYLGGKLREVFVVHGKAGGNDAAMSQAVSRLIGTALQHGVPEADIVKQLVGIVDTPVWDNGRQILSMPDAVGQTIANWGFATDIWDYDAEGRESDDSYYDWDVYDADDAPADECLVGDPDGCGNPVREEGCFKCYVCEYTKC